VLPADVVADLVVHQVPPVLLEARRPGVGRPVPPVQVQGDVAVAATAVPPSRVQRPAELVDGGRRRHDDREPPALRNPPEPEPSAADPAPRIGERLVDERSELVGVTPTAGPGAVVAAWKRPVAYGTKIVVDGGRLVVVLVVVVLVVEVAVVEVTVPVVELGATAGTTVDGLPGSEASRSAPSQTPASTTRPTPTRAAVRRTVPVDGSEGVVAMVRTR
jgi:hypothetical protein